MYDCDFLLVFSSCLRSETQKVVDFRLHTNCLTSLAVTDLLTMTAYVPYAGYFYW